MTTQLADRHVVTVSRIKTCLVIIIFRFFFFLDFFFRFQEEKKRNKNYIRSISRASRVAESLLS